MTLMPSYISSKTHFYNPIALATGDGFLRPMALPLLLLLSSSLLLLLLLYHQPSLPPSENKCDDEDLDKDKGQASLSKQGASDSISDEEDPVKCESDYEIIIEQSDDHESDEEIDNASEDKDENDEHGPFSYDLKEKVEYHHFAILLL